MKRETGRKRRLDDVSRMRGFDDNPLGSLIKDKYDWGYDVDPLEPPKKIKHKRASEPNASPPEPLMRSPPRRLTVEDKQNWNIPACVSQKRKNPKGYTRLLDKPQEVQINDKFAKFAESLSIAEIKVKEAADMSSKVEKNLMMKEKELKDQELRALAKKALLERRGRGSLVLSDEPVEREQEPMHVKERDRSRESKEEREERMTREKNQKILEERLRERDSNRRLEAKDAAMGKKLKIRKDRDRDISEKVGLGMASARTSRGGEVQYDQRLFNQEKGMDSGFATDDQYNVYDKGLFTAPPALSNLYRTKKGADDEMYGGADEQPEEIRKTDLFRPDKGFSGAGEKRGPRSGPVEFKKDVGEEADPFALDQFMTQVKGGKKPLDKVGSGGTMRSGPRNGPVEFEKDTGEEADPFGLDGGASGGSSTRQGYEGTCRSRIGFQKGR